jgi:acetyl-CoA carboxylase carboxyl transferase subunit alpha
MSYLPLSSQNQLSSKLSKKGEQAIPSDAIELKILDSMDRVKLSRHVKRPKGLDVIKAITSSFQELHGDRTFGDDPAVICGVGELGDERCIFIAQQKGIDSKEQAERNFGMMAPEGYRKALRVMKLAERFDLPVITIIDTPGAFPGLDAEKRGQARSIADNLYEMSSLKTPIISLILGEGCSGGALGIGIADKIIMLEHAYYSVISPEGCASILLKDARKSAQIVQYLKIHAEDLFDFKMIDAIINEGDGGFHDNAAAVFYSIKNEIIHQLQTLKQLSILHLLEHRAKKYRSI